MFLWCHTLGLCKIRKIYYFKATDYYLFHLKFKWILANYSANQVNAEGSPSGSITMILDTFFVKVICFDMTTSHFRSSLSWKHHIDVGAGVVDRDYRGNVGVVLFNLSKTDYEVLQGDRIAQLIFAPVCQARLHEVQELSTTERGAGGFGHTGI